MDRARHDRSPFKSLRKALRSECAPAALNQDLEHLTGVIDGPPEPAALPIDHQAEFIKVLDVRARLPSALQSSGVLRAEPQRPEADGFVRDLNPLGQHQFGHVT